jgi:hypothetical protein
MFGANGMLANAKAYKKTPMASLLDKTHIDSLRAYIRLPLTVQQAKPILMMFIEANPQLQHPSPETVLNNLIQFAITFRQFSGGNMLNLTMEQDVPIPLPAPEEKPKFEPPSPCAAPKKSLKIEEVETDDEIEAKLKELKKKLLLAKKKKALEDELEKLEKEDKEEPK